MSIYSSYKAELGQHLARLDEAALERLAQAILAAFREGKTIFVAGNGGSAATAIHMACDFCKTTLGKGKTLPNKRLRCIALAENPALMTAWGNDVSYDVIFAEQLRNLAQPGDLLISISASGNSPNVVECLKAAIDLKVKTFSLLGFQGGKAKNLSDDSIVVESQDYGVIEDAHSIIMHMVTARLKPEISG
ncbi:MAG: SIS domain-containing protein [Fimbriimonadaceae bacterium]|nr:SIS domain-containing protein [Fimbriimonadaceae bacterium]